MKLVLGKMYLFETGNGRYEVEVTGVFVGFGASGGFQTLHFMIPGFPEPSVFLPESIFKIQEVTQ